MMKKLLYRLRILVIAAALPLMGTAALAQPAADPAETRENVVPPGVAGAAGQQERASETTQWELKEMRMKITLPADLMVITRTEAVGQIERLADRGVEVAELQASMPAMNCYLVAIDPEVSGELNVVMAEYPGSRQIWDLRNFSEDELRLIAGKLKDADKLMKSKQVTDQVARNFGEEVVDDIRKTDFDFGQIYKGPTATFIVLQTEQDDQGLKVIGRRYCTMHNGQAINVIFNVFDQPWTEDHTRRVKQAVDSIVFTAVFPQPEQYKRARPQPRDNRWWTTLASTLPMIILVIWLSRARKKNRPF